MIWFIWFMFFFFGRLRYWRLELESWLFFASDVLGYYYGLWSVIDPLFTRPVHLLWPWLETFHELLAISFWWKLLTYRLGKSWVLCRRLSFNRMRSQEKCSEIREFRNAFDFIMNRTSGTTTVLYLDNESMSWNLDYYAFGVACAE